MVWQPKVNRHVDYRRADGKRRRGIVTGIVSGFTINIRIGRSGETYAGIVKGKAAGQYRPG